MIPHLPPFPMQWGSKKNYFLFHSIGHKTTKANRRARFNSTLLFLNKNLNLELVYDLSTSH
ncbi:hypothetical protein Syun_021277 [Stephania yunnanensis]|uniref:Uncharacterized protein n=1 Tax=Stephania yunnanensis TaxID=152371 RepID=A0AAP0IG39_9MAGN